MKTTIAFIVGCLALGISIGAQDVPGRGDLLANSFNKQSAHHRPIGTGAVYGILKDGVRTRGRFSVIKEVNLAPATSIKYMNLVKTSDIPYGTRCAIRPQDAGQRETLRLSEVGKLLFDAHLYYGVLVVDGTGAGNTGAKWNYRRDQGIPDNMKKDVDAQLKLIVPLLWPIDIQKNEP
jgi:hypothetical protein